MQRWTIKYVYGCYSGEEVVYTEDEATREEAIEALWRKLRPHMTLGMASRGAKVLAREQVRHYTLALESAPRPTSAADGPADDAEAQEGAASGSDVPDGLLPWLLAVADYARQQ